MNCHEEEKRDALVPYEKLLLGVPSADDQRTRTCTDYSEEAIPERDPAYQLPRGTLYETQTVEFMPQAKRLALVQRLMQFGMSASRAALVASLQ